MHNPLLFLARERELAEEAWPGDIVGIPNHGNLRIGDALTEGEELHFTGIPSFAPELLQRVRPIDPMRAKHLGRALVQLAEEGAAQVFRPRLGTDWIVGVAGALQFDVLADRMRTEYDMEVRFEGDGHPHGALAGGQGAPGLAEVPGRPRGRDWRGPRWAAGVPAFVSVAVAARDGRASRDHAS